MSLAVEQIDHVEVFVRDIEASVAWYRKVLGLVEVRRWGAEPVMIGVGGTKLALFAGEDGAEPPMGSGPKTPLRWRLVAWRVWPSCFEAAQKHLADCGVDFDGPYDRGDSMSIYFADLDGHPLEITCYVEG